MLELQNPIYQSALNDQLTSVCHCYRTVHSVSLFYIVSGVLIGIALAICASFIVLGDRFFEKKYQNESSMMTREKEKEKEKKNLMTIE